MSHAALVSSDVERTIPFNQDQLEFPLTELFENRDYPGSSHFFFDIGNGNLLGFFDFPNLDLGPYQEVFGGLHHVAISVEPKQWHHRGTFDPVALPPREPREDLLAALASRFDEPVVAAGALPRATT